MKHAIEQAACNDFHIVLACISTIDMPGPTRVMDDIKLSANIRKALLAHNDL